MQSTVQSSFTYYFILSLHKLPWKSRVLANQILILSVSLHHHPHIPILHSSPSTHPILHSSPSTHPPSLIPIHSVPWGCVWLFSPPWPFLQSTANSESHFWLLFLLLPLYLSWTPKPVLNRSPCNQVLILKHELIDITALIQHFMWLHFLHNITWVLSFDIKGLLPSPTQHH